MSIRARLRIRRGAFSLAAEFETPPRGVTGVFGPSGCGKTTLLRAIAGLETRTHGTLRVGDELWQDGRRSLPAHRRPVGMVFQEGNLFPDRSVRANVEYGWRRVPRGRRRIGPGEAADLLGLGGLLDRRPAGLSGGERQRVAIARALAVNPRLLLMDEPLSALDRGRRRELLPYLDRLHRELEMPILYVSHALDEIARLADHLVLLEAGRVLASGAPAELFARTDLPLAHDPDAESIVHTRVAGYQSRYGLLELEFAGGTFLVPGERHPEGSALRLRVLARDVSLTLSRARDTSILNIFPAQVEALEPEGRGHVTVVMRTGGQPLLARITRRSAEALALAPGVEVHAQIKSVAVLA